MAYLFQINGSGGRYTVNFSEGDEVIFTTSPVASVDETKAMIETIRMQTPIAGIGGDGGDGL